MYGNLKAFSGHDAFNDYAHHLRTFGEPMLPYGGLLWVIRVVLIVSLAVHVHGRGHAVAAGEEGPHDQVRREEEQALDVRLAT